MSDGVRGEFIQAQARADRVYQAFGDHADPPLQGENSIDYRRRLLKPYQCHSPEWRGVALPRNEEILRIAERQILADAAREARAPTNVPPGTLREIVETDQSGRRISRFYGDSEVTWGPFKLPSRRVIGIGRK